MKCIIVAVHGTNRRLQRYGVQMKIRTGAVPIDIYTITTTHSHLYHRVSNEFMHVALRLKCQL